MLFRLFRWAIDFYVACQIPLEFVKYIAVDCQDEVQCDLLVYPATDWDGEWRNITNIHFSLEV